MNIKEKQSINQFKNWSNIIDKKLYFSFLNSNKFVLENLNLNSNTRLLDIGCGTGILLKLIAEYDNSVQLFGLDISPEMIKVAQTKLNNEIKFYIQSANKLPFSNNFFDYTTCVTSFHHYPDQLNALKEMHRVLKPCGKMIVLDPFKGGFVNNTIIKFLDLIFNEKDVAFYTKQEMTKLINDAGFTSIHQTLYLKYKLLSIGIKN